MAAVRDIISHIEIETATRKRICHHNRKDHNITAGEKCLVISEQSGSSKNYCYSYGVAILTKARHKLILLETDFAEN